MNPTHSITSDQHCTTAHSYKSSSFKPQSQLRHTETQCDLDVPVPCDCRQLTNSSASGQSSLLTPWWRHCTPWNEHHAFP